MHVKCFLVLFVFSIVAGVAHCGGKKGGEAVVVVSNQGGGKCGNAKTIVKTGGGGKKGKKGGSGHTIIATSDNKCGCGGGKKMVEIPLPIPIHHPPPPPMMPLLEMKHDGGHYGGGGSEHGSGGFSSSSDLRPLYVREEMSSPNGHFQHHPSSPSSGSSSPFTVRNQQYDHMGSDSIAANRFFFAPQFSPHPMSPHPFMGGRVRSNPMYGGGLQYPSHYDMAQQMAMAASNPIYPMRGDFGNEPLGPPPHLISHYYGEPSMVDGHRFRDVGESGPGDVVHDGDGKIRGDIGSSRPSQSSSEAAESVVDSGKESPSSFSNINDDHFSSMWPEDVRKARRRDGKEQ